MEGGRPLRVVIQRVTEATVRVDEEQVAQISRGLLVFLGLSEQDTEDDEAYIIKKLISLRVFEDDEGKMNQSVADVNGGILIVPNFTLYGDLRKGTRPSFSSACPVALASERFERFMAHIRQEWEDVKQGVFQADMKVKSTNDGPVTMMLDSQRLF